MKWMYALALCLFALLLAGCVTYKRQTVSSVNRGWGACSAGTVNGKQATLCIDCAFCAGRKNCMVQGADGFYKKCPK